MAITALSRWRPAFAFAFAGPLALCALPADAGTRTLEYRIEHPVVGDIGYYRNIITRIGDSMTVQTTLRVVARVLGVVVHREDSDRTETWKGDRLVGFDGMTIANDRMLKVHGEAKDDKFVITTPRGTVVAPGDIRPTNLIDGSIFGHDIVMDTDDGKVERVTVTDDGLVSVTVQGQPMAARHFDVRGPEIGHAQVWINELGVPIQFIVPIRDSDILFRFTSIVDKTE
jgi:hypothetical protein